MLCFRLIAARPRKRPVAGYSSVAHTREVARPGLRFPLEVGGRQNCDFGSRIDYGDAKASADAVIAGFTTVLVQGGKPEDVPTFQTDINRAGAGLQKFCEIAVDAARSSKGTKGLIDGIVTSLRAAR